MEREGQAKGGEGARRGALQPYLFLDCADAYNKPVSTVKLMAQKPNYNRKLRHKSSVFSVVIKSISIRHDSSRVRSVRWSLASR
jgi:hypothetical protein